MPDSRFYHRGGPFTIQDLLAISGTTLADGGNPHLLIHDIAPLEKASMGHITCFHNPKYRQEFEQTKASACIIHPDYVQKAPDHLTILVSVQPYRAYGKIASLFYPPTLKEAAISPLANIHPTAKIGNNCYIGPFVVIEENATIGNNCQIGSHVVISQSVTIDDNCIIDPHVTIEFAIIGKRVHIKSGARIGQQGFGFHMDEKGHLSIPQLGRVIIENDVEIGSNTTIDRGAEPDTIIGAGTRIDNLVQIAHNVQIGENCVIVAQVGIAGSTKLGRYVVAAGQVGVTGHLQIGDGAKIAAQSGIMRDVAAGETVAGSPAVPFREWQRQTIALMRLGKK
jgi:UDP-3-O-[3-hydroxymyristoyl] glucosamine N-acyltransferase